MDKHESDAQGRQVDSSEATRSSLGPLRIECKWRGNRPPIETLLAHVCKALWLTILGIYIYNFGRLPWWSFLPTFAAMFVVLAVLSGIGWLIYRRPVDLLSGSEPERRQPAETDVDGG